MLNRWIFVLCLFFLAGFAKLAHLDELLTLQDFSNEQGAQAKYVQEQNAKFDALLVAVKNGTVESYASRDGFRNGFGEPVIKRQVDQDGRPLEMWIYRYPAKVNGAQKVYLYFDDQGKLVEWKHIAPPIPKEVTDGKIIP